MENHVWKTFQGGQVALESAEDLANLKNLDRKLWMAISMPVEGVRCDRRTLELIDTDHDGRIRMDEILGAVAFLEARGVPLAEVMAPPEGLADRLKEELAEDEERSIRYRLNLREILENYVNMRRLYDPAAQAVFQTGVLRIDAREMTLCFHVENEEAHVPLAEKSECCLLYVKLTRPSEEAAREICAVVTAGLVHGLYVGRNGVFFDRDGKDWEATVVKVVENQISLCEAFWAPWRKIGEAVTGVVKKFLGEKQDEAVGKIGEVATKPAAAGGNGAALASSIAAIGIGAGMVTAAAASLMAALSHMTALQIVGSLAAIVAIVSLPSVILTWFKLRRRDLGALLNAGGWAVNRPLRISCSLARTFTAQM